jgi:hypothetical protein
MQFLIGPEQVFFILTIDPLNFLILELLLLRKIFELNPCPGAGDSWRNSILPVESSSSR